LASLNPCHCVAPTAVIVPNGGLSFPPSWGRFFATTRKPMHGNKLYAVKIGQRPSNCHGRRPNSMMGRRSVSTSGRRPARPPDHSALSQQATGGRILFPSKHHVFAPIPGSHTKTHIGFKTYPAPIALPRNCHGNGAFALGPFVSIQLAAACAARRANLSTGLTTGGPLRLPGDHTLIHAASSSHRLIHATPSRGPSRGNWSTTPGLPLGSSPLPSHAVAPACPSLIRPGGAKPTAHRQPRTQQLRLSPTKRLIFPSLNMVLRMSTFQ
jgi:hypothetical protein